MKYLQTIAVTHMAVLVASSPAMACLVSKPLHPSDFTTAEIIIVGRVTNYEAVADPIATERTRRLLETSPSRRLRAKDYKSISYGRLDLEIDDVLKGKLPAQFAIYWLPGTAGPSDTLAPGRYILGLGRVDTLSTHYENRLLLLPLDALTIGEKACAGAFITQYSSELGKKVGELLKVHPQP
ncbi:hypothetical protein ASC97_28995 [Rhizobium sp. Root1203]|uniref:hypothetical protein n=1 Tax=Rhizobium sp. Root1203 TaxID=1736427 RepID=UPI00070D80F2|nr:hypothetical protein [Rhizobium sp. Root1203]KQV19709.1 hypothetical protein ASC97_28995 [Rhizobium sp. Root1203]